MPRRLFMRSCAVSCVVADYSALDKLLHRLALGSQSIAEMVHDIERARFLKSSPQARDGKHVYVSGLARAGTTILMHEIYATGSFASLTYADMPFVLAPNLWAGLARSKSVTARTERAHGDGIEVDSNSPEALEEVFWRIFCGEDYVTPTGLLPHSPSAQVIDDYVDFIRLVLRRYGKSRYLAKNNNAILRIGTLAKVLPNSVFLIPIRTPLQHAQSLLSQHRRFLNSEPFTKNYMTWLAHHEFGATQRPFLVSVGPADDPLTLDYWLKQWILVYTKLTADAANNANAYLVPHEDLTLNPAVWPAICAKIGIAPGSLSEARTQDFRAVDTHDQSLAARAQELYQTHCAAALAKLGA